MRANLVAKAVTLVLLSEVVYHTYYWLFPPSQKDDDDAKKRTKQTKRPVPTFQDNSDGGDPVEMADEERRALNRRKPYEKWNTVLFFPDLLPDRIDSPTKQLLSYIDEAKVTIYICMYLCSNYDFSGIVKKKHSEGKLVKVITDYDTWTAHNNSGLIYLKRNGIETRIWTNGYLMHNKFVIIDEEAVLTGSLNWTKQGVTSNNENVMISTDPRIVAKYLEEYNRIWSKCSDVPASLGGPKMK